MRSIARREPSSTGSSRRPCRCRATTTRRSTTFTCRLLRPWRRYRRYIDRDLEPTFEDDEIAVVGVNTVNHLSWQRGRIGRHTVRRVCGAFAGHEERRMHIAMLHHPLEHLPEVEKRLMRGARKALARLGECGADIVLSGHLHTWRAETFADESGVLLVQAGTGLSTRHRDEPNDFNLLTIEGRAVRVDRFVAPIGETAFTRAASARFEKTDGAWWQAA